MVLCRLEASFLHETPSSITAECLSPLPLSTLDSHITREQGRQQLPWPPAFSVPVYLPPYHLRNGPSVSPSPSLPADHKRHRKSVAKYLYILELFDEGFDDTKSAEETR